MKKRSILIKMLITYVLIIAVSFTILSTLLTMWFKDYYINYAKDQLINKTSPIYKVIDSYSNGEIQEKELVEKLELISYYFQGSVCIVTKNNKVIVSSDKTNKNINKKELFKRLANNNLKKYISKSKKNSVYKFDNKTRVNVIETEIYNSKNKYFGKIIIFIDTSHTTKNLCKICCIIWILAIVAIVFPSITIYVFTQRSILKPLLNINEAAKKLAKGEVCQRVIIKSNDEIGELSKSFNYMAESLEKIDENRRQFISNVSHEVRTPITSIKGFITGMIDGVIPKEMHTHYLKITYQEIERLIRLINDLLDLSSLESGEFSQDLKEVDIVQIIKSSICKFEQAFREKALKLSIQVDEEAILVLGDKDRLIQVMTNLIDNAVKYSIKGGTIKISCKSKLNKVYIRVFNSTNKIDDNDINKIWERFYRIDKARSSKCSSGLGLSIVREIISNLNEDIWVENGNEGIRFIFTLTKVKN